jgi:hypothetical protein
MPVGNQRALSDAIPAPQPRAHAGPTPAPPQAGLRTLALAHRRLPPGTARGALAALGPDVLEAGLAFSGLALMENALKPDSARVVAELRQAALQVGLGGGPGPCAQTMGGPGLSQWRAALRTLFLVLHVAPTCLCPPAHMTPIITLPPTSHTPPQT